jgi:hypothetical protein
VISSPVYRWLTFLFCHAGQAYSHFLWCEAKRSLQDFSMVFTSLYRTHWGFTASVSIAPHQKPSCALWVSAIAALPTPSHDSTIVASLNIPAVLPSQLPHIAGWYAKTSLYHILRQVVPIYTLMFVLFSWVIACSSARWRPNIRGLWSFLFKAMRQVFLNTYIFIYLFCRSGIAC